MSEIVLPDYQDLISTARAYDLEESIVASGYPMARESKAHPMTEQDYARALRLSQNPNNSGHPNFMKGMLVAFDLTFTKQAWSQAERYGHFTLVSSESVMHRLASMDLAKVYIKHVDPEMIERCKQLQDRYNETHSDEDFQRLVYSSPAGIRLMCRISTNYMQLKTIYQQRRHHKLPEWQGFCDWIETLPYSELITGEVKR